MPAGEPSKFGEFDSEMGLWQLGGGPQSVTFFPGAGFSKRMDEVRQAISHIRLHWDQYPQFMGELRTFLGKVPEPSVRSLEEREGVPEHSARSREFEAYWEDGRSRVEALLSSRKEWPELRDGPGNDDYSAIRLYTSIYGYLRMFGAMNVAFRRLDITRDPAEIRAVTFLVELLNIDLYSYIRANPRADNFEGRVYRGMRLSSKGIADYARAAANEDFGERYMAVPLSMMSASVTRSKSLAFARRTDKTPADSHALLLDVSVYSLDPALLEAYRQAFPESIVTSLCSVPIHRLSDLPEDEVLLRGPLFQIIRMYRDEDSLRDEPLHVVQAIMLNSNRDHVTAVATNTGKDKHMRDIFRVMVTASRSTRCAEHAETYGLAADSDKYRNAAAQAYAYFSANI
jgi:hypothetical protein